MININSTITYSPTGNRGICDRAREIDGWNIEQARHEAKEHGVDISDEHLDVIQFLRDYYVENGWPKRRVSNILRCHRTHSGPGMRATSTYTYTRGGDCHSKHSASFTSANDRKSHLYKTIVVNWISCSVILIFC